MSRRAPCISVGLTSVTGKYHKRIPSERIRERELSGKHDPGRAVWEPDLRRDIGWGLPRFLRPLLNDDLLQHYRGVRLPLFPNPGDGRGLSTRLTLKDQVVIDTCKQEFTV